MTERKESCEYTLYGYGGWTDQDRDFFVFTWEEATALKEFLIRKGY